MSRDRSDRFVSNAGDFKIDNSAAVGPTLAELDQAAAKREPAAQAVITDRAVGALLGLAVGDALGTTLEFRSRDSYLPLTDMVGGGPFDLAPGIWTDDTAMALALADSLAVCQGLDARDLLLAANLGTMPIRRPL